MPDAIDRVGIGVDLYGGQIVLQELRAIREEMKLIAGMGTGNRPPGGGSSGARDIDFVETRIKTKEKAEIDSIKKIAKVEADANRAISKDEINVYADLEHRKAEVRRLGNEERIRREKQTQTELTRIAEQGEMERQQMITRQRNQFANTRSPTLAKQTNELLDQTPIRTRSGIGVVPGPNRFGYTSNQQLSYIAQNLPIVPRSSIGIIPGPEKRRREINQRINERAEKEVESRIEKDARGYARLRQMLDENTKRNRAAIIEEGQLRQKNFEEYKAQRTQMARSLAESGPIGIDQSLRARLHKVRNDPAAINDPTTQGWRNELAVEMRASRIQRDHRTKAANEELARLESEGLRRENIQARWNQRAIDRANRHNEVISKVNGGMDRLTAGGTVPTPVFRAGYVPPGGGRGGGGGNPPDSPPTPPTPPIGPKAGLFNDKGFFTTGDAVGRITRNILLYEVVSRASYGLVTYIQNAITAAKVTVEFGNALRFATQQAGGNIGENERLADSLGAIGLSRQQGRAAVTEAARFAINRPEDTGALTKTVADIAAARGLGVDKTDELIEQLRRRESKFYKRIFGTTVESIYEAEAAKSIDRQTTTQDKTPGLYVGLSKSEIKSRTESINDFVGAMDDAAKETAIFNYILSQSGRFAGEAAERADTLAGRIDKIAASFLNAQENVGLFITELKPVNALVDKMLGGAGFLEKLRPAMLQRTGSGGSISQADIQQYAQEKTTGFRAKALEEVNTFGGPLVLGGLAATGLGLLGRGQAQQQVRTQAHEKAYTKYMAQFEGNVTAAQTAAYEEARNLKPGMVNSVKAGVGKLTLGMTDAILTNVNSAIGSNLQTSAGYQRTRFVPNLVGQDLVGQGDYGRLTGHSLAATGRYMPYITGSPYKPTTIAESDIRDLNRLSAGAGMVGGLTGGIIGANLGALAAESLKVGPITATGLTIAGGVIGTAVGTTVGQTIASVFSDYVIKSGGLRALITGGAAGGIGAIAASEGGVAGAAGAVSAGASSLAGGFGALMTETVALGTMFGALATAGTVIVGLLTGGAIGAAINYINPFDPMSQEQRTLDRQAAADEANKRRIKELTQSSKEGLVRYTDLLPGSPTFNQSFSERQARMMPGFELGFEGRNRRFSQQILQGNEPILKADTIEKVRQQRLDIEAKITTQYENRQEIEEELARLRRKDPKAPENKYIQEVITPLEEQLVLYEKLGKLKSAEENFKLYGSNDPAQIAATSDYRARQRESIQARLEKDAKEAEIAQNKRNEQVAQQGNALAKLRDAQQGGFRLVYDRAANDVGGDNPFVKLLADEATLQQRMQQQFGFRGPKAVEEAVANELKAISRALNSAEFGVRDRIGRIAQQIGRESDQRGGPGLGRRDQDYLDVQNAIVDKAKEIPELWKEAAQIVNLQRLSITEEITGRINLINQAFGVRGVTIRNRLDQDITNRDNTRTNAFGQPIDGYFEFGRPRRNALDQSLEDPDIAGIFQNVGRGESPELQRALQKGFADTLIESFRGFTPQQIRASGQGELYYNALRFKTNDQTAIQDAIRKQDMGLREDYRLKQVLAGDDYFSRDQVLKGRNPEDVRKEANKLILSRTEGINPKDLTFDQFAARQEALRATAQQEVNDQREAKEAVEQGLLYQESMNNELQIIREAILGGSVTALITVQNDIQARIDQEALQKNQGQGYQVPLDQGQTKVNPYAGSLASTVEAAENDRS